MLQSQTRFARAIGARGRGSFGGYGLVRCDGVTGESMHLAKPAVIVSDQCMARTSGGNVTVWFEIDVKVADSSNMSIENGLRPAYDDRIARWSDNAIERPVWRNNVKNGEL